eukprot:g2835.t1
MSAPISLDVLTALILAGPIIGLVIGVLLLYDRAERRQENEDEHVRFRIFDSSIRRRYRRQLMQGLVPRRRHFLVVGGSGFVGHRIVEALLSDETLKDQILVRVFDHRKPKKSEYHANVTYFIGDVRNAAHLANAMHGVSVVFHCASAGPWLGASAAYQRAVNVDGARNVVDACLESGVGKLILTSTAYVALRKTGRGSAVGGGAPDDEPSERWGARWDASRRLSPVRERGDWRGGGRHRQAGGSTAGPGRDADYPPMAAHVCAWAAQRREAEQIVLAANGTPIRCEPGTPATPKRQPGRPDSRPGSRPTSPERGAAGGAVGGGAGAGASDADRCLLTCVLRPSIAFGLRRKRVRSLLLDAECLFFPQTRALLDLVPVDHIARAHVLAEAALSAGVPPGFGAPVAAPRDGGGGGDGGGGRVVGEGGEAGGRTTPPKHIAQARAHIIDDGRKGIARGNAGVAAGRCYFVTAGACSPAWRFARTCASIGNTTCAVALPAFLVRWMAWLHARWHGCGLGLPLWHRSLAPFTLELCTATCEFDPARAAAELGYRPPFGAGGADLAQAMDEVRQQQQRHIRRRVERRRERLSKRERKQNEKDAGAKQGADGTQARGGDGGGSGGSELRRRGRGNNGDGGGGEGDGLSVATGGGGLPGGAAGLAHSGGRKRGSDASCRSEMTDRSDMSIDSSYFNGGDEQDLSGFDV